MGEQPNPWDLLQPQDATSRHRTSSHITVGADYIFTLPRVHLGEGPACDSGHRFARLQDEHGLLSHGSAVARGTDQSLRGHLKNVERELFASLLRC